MRANALGTYAAAHRYGHLIAWAFCVGLVAWLAGTVPVPAVAASPGAKQSQAVAFYLAPLAMVPVAARVLGGSLIWLEQYTARSLRLLRAIDVVAIASTPIVLLLPAASRMPPHNTQVCVQNVLLVTAAVVVLDPWISGKASWIPIYASALAGIMGPQEAHWVQFMVANRAASDTRLSYCGAIAGLALALHLASRPRRSRFDPAR